MTNYKLPNRVGAWIQGFVNGRSGTAGIGESGQVESGYIHALKEGYAAYATACRRTLADLVLDRSAHLQEVLCQYVWVKSPPEAEPGTPQAIRAAQRQRTRQEELTREMILTLSEISQAMESYNLSVGVTAHRVNRVRACYTKGVLCRRAVTADQLPLVAAPACTLEEDYFDLLPIIHHAQEILQEVSVS